MSSEYKISDRDIPLIKTTVESYLRRLVKSGKKLWYKYVDVDTVVRFIAQHDNSWIVDETYLVVYDVGTPWYAKPDVKYLEEILVLRLRRGPGNFSRVPAFLERKAGEAGVMLLGVGTALARNDAALASLYKQAGFHPETTILVKEP